MTKPDDIPQWAWGKAEANMMAAFAANSLGRKVSDREMVARAILSAVEEERERNGAYRQAVEAIADADPVNIALDPSWPIRVAGAARREIRSRKETYE